MEDVVEHRYSYEIAPESATIDIGDTAEWEEGVLSRTFRIILSLMSLIADSVALEYSRTEQSATPPKIEQADVDEAILILRFLRINQKSDAFLYLSAINLLNAAIKQPAYKKKLGYGFIKGKALLAARIIITRMHDKSIRYYYDTEEKCLYIEVYNIVFSFHNILEDALILEKAANANKIVWPGIRLQRIAPFLFSFARIMNNREEA